MFNCTKTNTSLSYGGFSHSYTFYRVKLTQSVIIAFLSPVATIGNALVLAAIWRNQNLRTPPYILLAGLAFTDLCTGVVTDPLYVASALMLLRNPQLIKVHFWSTSYRTIRAISFTSAKYFYLVSLLLVTVISVERWLHMSRRSVMTVRRTWFAVTTLFVIAIPLALNGSEEITRVNPIVYYATSISLLLLCITVTSIAYFKIFRIIRRHQQQIHATASSQNFAHQAINFDKYKRSIFSILYILFVFYLGCLPLSIFFTLALVLKRETPFLLTAVSTTLVFLSSSLNPLLYLWRMKDIRDEIKRLIKRIFHKGN